MDEPLPVDRSATDRAGEPPIKRERRVQNATSIRLGALEERVRLLESAAQGVVPTSRTWATEAGVVTDLRSARSTRGVVATQLAALGHPSRLELLMGVVRGATSTTELAAELGTGSTGQLYHHLNQLVAAGWLQTSSRGRYEIPAGRRDALAAVLAAVSPAAAAD
ncbi:winged helix-turn-helix domain-containing protein [Nakamurella sp. A5-74]|uniref:Winged helix-turn-helix domain-containing protein n=1 Tax=Nakamurella sp. A5-74 TaxID=3158264 RepID=A0AAU8DQ61_9ACTN